MTRLPDPRVGRAPAVVGAPQLVDALGRVATDLRVSVTDRCNLRCTYCMPAEGLPWLPHHEVLTDEELLRLIAIFVEHGVTKVRLTGGEPLLRHSLESLIEGIAALDPRPEIALTTNGLGLAKRARALAEAGLDRVNVSLDTVDQQTFTTLSRRDRLGDVLAGMAEAASSGLTPVKVNAVAMPGINDEQVGDLLAYCLDHDYHLRFIEQMPLDAQHGWKRDQMVTAQALRARLSEHFSLTPHPAYSRGSAPTELFLVDGGPGTVGIIASVTAPFCGACDRVRLTADGQVRNCLFSRGEVDLRAPLRAGASDDAIGALIREEMWRKQAAHGIDDPDFHQPDRPMSAIGG